MVGQWVAVGPHWQRLANAARLGNSFLACHNNPFSHPTLLARPAHEQDFEEALKEVGPSVDPDSSTIQVCVCGWVGVWGVAGGWGWGGGAGGALGGR